jgi:precorrin-2 dehydrogenase/sirohydrochlorin ferrochelatase
MLDVTDRQIVIIGGGAVAARKAAGLADAGAKKIRVIATEFRADFPPIVERVTRPYAPGDLKDAVLVFAATDSATINDAVVADARALGILVCRADAGESGDFSTPAKFQSGSITVTVSAGSAALSAMVRDELEARFDPAWSAMADAMKQLRPIIKSAGIEAYDRAEIFRRLATPQAMVVLRDKGIDGLKDWILQP